MAQAMNDDQRREKVRAMVSGIRTCMFTTLDGQGRMHARPMAAMTGPDAEDTIWFFTRADSPKATEIGAEGQVLLTFAQGNDYLSLTGEAVVMRDVEQQKALWSEAARVWFPGGAESEELALIAFQPGEAQYWDSPSGLVLFAYGYARAVLTGKPPQAGENEKVAFTG